MQKHYELQFPVFTGESVAYIGTHSALLICDAVVVQFECCGHLKRGVVNI